MYILEKTEKLSGKKICYLEQPEGDKCALFLHGKSYTSENWLKLHHTIGDLYRLRYKFYAFDFPGFGKSESNNVDPIDFIKTFIDNLNLKNVVLIGASMSGGFALRYAVKYPDNLRAIVAMAPAGIENEIKNLSKITIPALFMWGKNDNIVPPSLGNKLKKAIKNSELFIFKNLSHPFYFENEELFKTNLLKFLEKIEN